MVRVAVVWLVFLCCPAFGQGPDPDPLEEDAQEEGRDTEQQAKSESSPEQQIAIPPEAGQAYLGPANPAADKADQDQPEPPESMFEWPPRFAARDSYAQWIMMLAGIVATFVSIYATWLLRGTLRYTRDAAKATARTLKVTEDTLEVTRRHTEAQIRAYMTLGPVKVEKLREDDGTVMAVRVTLDWINSGHSPAYNVRSCGKSLIFKGDDTPVLDLSSALEGAYPDTVGQSRTVPGQTMFTAEAIGKCLREEYRAIVYSACAYEDIFGRAYLMEATLTVNWPPTLLVNQTLIGVIQEGITLRAFGSQNGERLIG